MKKYKLDKKDTIKHGHQTLYRVVALRDFGDVKQGDRGGYIFSEDNLSQWGTCWVYDKAIITDMASFRDDALITESAKIRENARISCEARIRDRAVISGKAKVQDNAMIYGKAQVSGNVLVRDRVRICGNALLNGNTMLSGLTFLNAGVWEKSPIQIQGPRDWIHQISPTHVAIGDMAMHVDDWLEEYKAIGAKRKYSPEEVEELGIYLNVCKPLVQKGE